MYSYDSKIGTGFVSHTQTKRLMEQLGQDGGTKQLQFASKISIMLKKIHKFASVTSRPIAISSTRKHTHGQINEVVQPRNELKIWNPWKMLLLHNTRETLARLLNRQIRTCAQPIRDKTYGFLSTENALVALFVLLKSSSFF